MDFKSDDLKENSTKLNYKTISELNRYNFSIPSYQRGYRWSRVQVGQLIEDVYKRRNDVYYLQHLSVSQIDVNKKIKYNVIDGQQRLTTVRIMIGVLNYLNRFYRQILIFENDFYFSLEYESRKNSKSFLDFLTNSDYIYDITPSDLNESIVWNRFSILNNNTIANNLDFEYMSCAFCECVVQYQNILRERIYTLKELGYKLLNNCKFVWYPIATTNNKRQIEIEQFTKMNMGKIELTDAELIKAEIMNPNHFKMDISLENKSTIQKKQISIAESWYFIENELHKPDFWCFLPHENQYSKYIDYSTRIDILFEYLLLDKKFDNNEQFIDINFSSDYLLFFEVHKLLTIIDAEYLWYKIKDLFENLKQLYEDDGRSQIYNIQNNSLNIGIYNLLSFLVCYQHNKKSSYTSRQYQQSYKIFYEILKVSRDKRINYIKQKIKDIVFQENDISEKIRNMRYAGQKNEDLREILLLYNIIILSKSSGIGNRFNFIEYNCQEWTREHIFPQKFESSENDNNKDEAREEKREDILKFITRNLDVNGNVVLRNEPILRYVNYLYGKEDYDDRKQNIWNKKYYKPIEAKYEAIENQSNKKNVKLSIINFTKDERAIENFLNSSYLLNRDCEYIEEYVNKLKLLKLSKNYLKYIKKIKVNRALIDKVKDDRANLESYESVLESIKEDWREFNELDRNTFISKFPEISFKIENIEQISMNGYFLSNRFPFYPFDKNSQLIDSFKEECEQNIEFKELWNSQFITLLINIYINTVDNVRKDDFKNINLIKIKEFLIVILESQMVHIQKKVDDFFKYEFDRLTLDNTIGNMALLDKYTNSSKDIGNSLYNIKKEKIYKHMKDGSFIPLSTMLVFAGVYNSNKFTDEYWMYEDRYKYLNDIITTIENFLK